MLILAAKHTILFYANYLLVNNCPTFPAPQIPSVFDFSGLWPGFFFVFCACQSNLPVVM